MYTLSKAAPVSLPDFNFDLVTNERHREVLEALLLKSKAEVRREFSLSYSGLTYILNQYNISTKVPKPVEDKNCSGIVSAYHVRVGGNIMFYRTEAGYYDRAEFAELINMNVMKLNMMETGRMDFTLSDLIKISGACGCPLPALVNIPQELENL